MLADADLIVALATNGTLIDADVARKIRDSGVRRVSISFDGADAPTHDIFRGEGALTDAALEGARYLTEAGVPFQINTTVAKHNSHQMPDTLELAHRHRRTGAPSLPAGAGRLWR